MEIDHINLIESLRGLRQQLKLTMGDDALLLQAMLAIEGLDAKCESLESRLSSATQENESLARQARDWEKYSRHRDDEVKRLTEILASLGDEAIVLRSAQKMLSAELAAAKALVPRWIPCSERLPPADSDDSYLVRRRTIHSDHVFVTDIVDFEEGCWQYDCEILAWMQLPASSIDPKQPAPAEKEKP